MKDENIKRCGMERAALYSAALRVDAANAKRANAKVQDQIVRLDYEDSMGAALDNLRRVIDEIRARRT